MFQKYEDIKDLEPEFIPYLEELLSSKIPSFEFLKQKENSTPKECLYFLVFGDRDNSPRGFIKGIINVKKRFFFKSSRFVNWGGPVDYPLIVDPKFNDEFQRKFSEVRSRTELEYDVNEHLIKVSTKSKQADFISKEEKVDTLFKSHSNYQSYLESLSTQFQKQVRAAFEDVKDHEIHFYQDIKDCFSYRPQNRDNYKQLKRSKIFKSLESRGYCVGSIENQDKLSAICIVFYGINGNAFYLCQDFTNDLGELILLQLSIMTFYNEKNLNYLHPLEMTSLLDIHTLSNFSSFLSLEYTG